jgi:hypothetical protein
MDKKTLFNLNIGPSLDLRVGLEVQVGECKSDTMSSTASSW